jgi:hypothetical protein
VASADNVACPCKQLPRQVYTESGSATCREEKAQAFDDFIHLLSILILAKHSDTFSLLPALPFQMTGWSFAAPESVYGGVHV